MITLENVRAKIEKRTKVKGLERVYNRFKWPLDGPEIQKSIDSIQRDAQILQFALTVKDSEILSQVAKQASQTLSTSQEYVHVRFQ